MLENSSFELMVECEDCKKRFPVSSNVAANSITHKKEFKVNGQSIFLTYYDCPHCGKRHFVQIDDTNSMQELARVSSEFVKLNVAMKRGKRISKRQSEKFKESRQHLAEYRMNLMQEYTGKVVIDVTGIPYTLRFIV